MRTLLEQHTRCTGALVSSRELFNPLTERKREETALQRTIGSEGEREPQVVVHRLRERERGADAGESSHSLAAWEKEAKRRRE